MEFQDQEIVCIDCNAPFTFTAAEQQFYQEKGLTHAPKRCKPCRAARKNQPQGDRGRRSQPPAPGQAGGASGPLFKASLGPAPGAGRGPRRGGSRDDRRQAGGAGRRPVHLFDAVCSDCDAPTQVPFRPNGVQPVYCRACLPKYKAQRARNRADGSGTGGAQA